MSRYIYTSNNYSIQLLISSGLYRVDREARSRLTISATIVGSIHNRGNILYLKFYHFCALVDKTRHEKHWISSAYPIYGIQREIKKK